VTKYAEFANCSVCRRAPGSGDGSCPFRGSWFDERRDLRRHECVSFKPISDGALLKRRLRATETGEQESLF
jgi:hypothetical protein